MNEPADKTDFNNPDHDNPELPAPEQAAATNPFAEADLVNEQLAAERASAGKYVAQIPTIGYLMLVHGVLLTAMGLFFALLFGVFAMIPFPEGPNGSPPFPQEIFGLYVVAFLILCVLPGVLQFISGWKLVRKRGRFLGVLAACIGLISALTTFCAPTSIGLAIYALVVLCNPEVVRQMDGES